MAAIDCWLACCSLPLSQLSALSSPPHPSPPSTRGKESPESASDWARVTQLACGGPRGKEQSVTPKPRFPPAQSRLEHIAAASL